MKRLLCLFGNHNDHRHFVLRPYGHDINDPAVMHTKLQETRTCTRCGRVEMHVEFIPLQYIVSDD